MRRRESSGPGLDRAHHATFSVGVTLVIGRFRERVARAEAVLVGCSVARCRCPRLYWCGTEVRSARSKEGERLFAGDSLNRSSGEEVDRRAGRWC